VDKARAVKPSIPLIGDYGISIHDELELELRLGSARLEILSSIAAVLPDCRRTGYEIRAAASVGRRRGAEVEMSASSADDMPRPS
jgi:hypothetical protein